VGIGWLGGILEKVLIFSWWYLLGGLDKSRLWIIFCRHSCHRTDKTCIRWTWCEIELHCAFNCSTYLLYQAHLTWFLFQSFSLLSIYLFICFASKSRVISFPFVKYRWHAVASWTWDAQDETCGICRMAFDGCCPDCKLPGDDCPLSKLLIILYADFHHDYILLVYFSCNL